MTPQEKAQDLIEKHYIALFDSDSDKGEEILVTTLAKKAALITVDEIENALTDYGRNTDELGDMDTEWRYWDKVRIEIRR
jgi:hypothetical protein